MFFKTFMIKPCKVYWHLPFIRNIFFYSKLVQVNEGQIVISQVNMFSQGIEAHQFLNSLPANRIVIRKWKQSRDELNL